MLMHYDSVRGRAASASDHIADARVASAGDQLTTSEAQLQIFQDNEWELCFGERAALVGLLAQLKPSVSLSIGHTDAAVLRILAAHSDEVHTFGYAMPDPGMTQAANLSIHEGDRASFLSQLSTFAEADRNVDFAVLASSDDVRVHVEDLLNSPCIRKSILVIRDTSNHAIRASLDLVRYGAWPKVAIVDLDFVPGYMFSEERLKNELWGGLGLIAVDASRTAYGGGLHVEHDRHYPVSALYALAREQIETSSAPGESASDTGGGSRTENLLKQIAELESEMVGLAHHEQIWRSMQNSVSWRVTAPLRLLAARARR